MYYILREFEDRCEKKGIEFESCEYFVNEGTKYEFRNYMSLVDAFVEYMKAVQDNPESKNFKATLTANDHGHFLFIHLTDAE